MLLHEDQRGFKRVLNQTAESMHKPVAFVLKDYYLTELLRRIVQENGQLVFKGGTALSKCHHVISRFSEDIDLGIEKAHATEGERRSIKRTVKAAVDEMGLNIANLSRIQSKREFNRYEVPLPTGVVANAISSTLYIETAVMTPITPTTVCPISSFVSNHLMISGSKELVYAYGLEPFEITATSLDRSFCDKVFAVCDYYLEERDLEKPSRHLYDLYKLSKRVELDEDLIALFDSVRDQRHNSSLRCPSADPSVSLSAVLRDLVQKAVYKHGYENTTLKLLDDGEYVSYEEASDALLEIAAFLDDYSK